MYILGTGYAFISSANPQAGWTISEKSVKNLTSIPGRILGPIYGQKSDKNLFHMFYNDAHPDDKTSFYLGHTKGQLISKCPYEISVSSKIPMKLIFRKDL